MTPVTPSYNIAGSKACVAPVDPLNPSWSAEDWNKCRNNQGKMNVSVTGTEINIEVTGELESWASSQGQGTKEWLALGVNTNTNDITTIKYGNYQFTSADVAEANEWSLDPGYFVLWLDGSTDSIKTFTLSPVTEGDYEPTEVTIHITAYTAG